MSPRQPSPQGDELVAELGADHGTDHERQDSQSDAPIFGDSTGRTSTFIDRQPQRLAEPANQGQEPSSTPEAFEVQESDPQQVEPAASADSTAMLLELEPEVETAAEQSAPDDEDHAEALQTAPGPATGLTIQCDYDACSTAYRSFRRSDCTYQPYQGPRRLCQRGATVVVTPDGVDRQVDLDTLELGSISSGLSIEALNEAAPRPAAQCNYDACSRAYQSFRRSDCTFQPYSGPRKLCEK
jgi:hypothetical protein